MTKRVNVQVIRNADPHAPALISITLVCKHYPAVDSLPHVKHLMELSGRFQVKVDAGIGNKRRVCGAAGSFIEARVGWCEPIVLKTAIRMRNSCLCCKIRSSVRAGLVDDGVLPDV